MNTLKEKIIAVLRQLQFENEAHWTTDDLPRVDVIQDLLGGQVSRFEIESAVKGFSRTNMDIPNDVESQPNDVENADTSDTLDADALVEKELEDATLNLSMAKDRYDAAVSNMDAVIERRDREANGERSNANDIKIYQRSQAKQREETARTRNAMVEAVKLTAAKF